nr:YgjV family protein [Allomuricauda sp.]
MIQLADAIGYFALLLNLYSMSARGEKRLRIISLVANCIYILYGLLIDAWPITIGCTIAVFLHAYRLYKMKTTVYGTNSIG